jgi:SAM-dependent methyltransferase
MDKRYRTGCQAKVYSLAAVDVLEQVRRGALVCPVSRSQLRLEDGALAAAEGGARYRLVEGVPILLPDEGDGRDYLAQEGGAMADEYGHERGLVALRRRIDNWVNRRDTRPPVLKQALERTVREQGPDPIVVSVGGGPDRWGDQITNLNIDRFPNVDVVGDAYALPYADGSVDGILCWAVIEHLEFPERAVAEMHRVLRPAGLALFNTPFLQAFHAYPNHFQNLTVVGQDRMLERAGFTIEASGAQGATFALIDLVSVYVRSFLPGRVVGGVIARLLRLLAVLTAPLDRRLAVHPRGHVVASNVFSLARKPG